jgi:4-phytase/acid phosphatase
MAAHQSAVLGREILQALAGAGPRLQLLMGHDTNVTAVAAALSVDLMAPGYAINDVPPGGALLFERVRRQRTGAAYVRVSYRTQSPGAQRELAPTISLIPLRVPGCGQVLCPIGTFERRFRLRLAPMVHELGPQAPRIGSLPLQAANQHRARGDYWKRRSSGYGCPQSLRVHVG